MNPEKMEPVDLNSYLASRSYISGHQFTYSDQALFTKVSGKYQLYKDFKHVHRWFYHIKEIRKTSNEESQTSDAKVVNKVTNIAGNFVSPFSELHDV